MNTRELCLEKAKECVLYDRNNTYGGDPEDSFGVIAKLWDVYLGNRLCRDFEESVIDATDVAIMMALLKIGRIITGYYNEDNYIDLAGYAACAMECAADANRITYSEEEEEEITKTLREWNCKDEEIKENGKN